MCDGFLCVTPVLLKSVAGCQNFSPQPLVAAISDRRLLGSSACSSLGLFPIE